jgi:uncharacterized protein YuzE
VTEHALFEMKRRGLSEETLRQVLSSPDQRIDVRPGRVALQSRVAVGVPVRLQLLRVVVDIDREPAEVVTAYRTSKMLKYLEARIVKASYDPTTDTLSLIFKEDATVFESDEDKPGVILDYDESGNLVSVEILDASRRVTEASKMEFRVAG